MKIQMMSYNYTKVRQVGLSILLLTKVNHSPEGVRASVNVCLFHLPRAAPPIYCGSSVVTPQQPPVTGPCFIISQDQLQGEHFPFPSVNPSWNLWVVPPQAMTLQTQRCTVWKWKVGEELSMALKNWHIGCGGFCTNIYQFSTIIHPLLLIRDA